MKLGRSIFYLAYSQIDLKDCVIRIKDGTSNEITVKIGEGTLVFTERQNVEYTLNGGNLDEVRLGDQVPVEVRLDAIWDFYSGTGSQSAISSSSSNPTVADAIKGDGSASGWSSTDSDSCRPYAVDLVIDYDADCSGGAEDVTLADFRYEQIDFDLGAGTLSVSGKCNIIKASSNR